MGIVMIERKEVERVSVDDVIEVFRKHYYIEPTHEQAIELALATVVSVHLWGETIWLNFVAPPGSFKTELIRAFKESKRVEFVSTMTTNTFISGWTTGEDLLAKLDKRTLAIKDLTTILEKSPYEMREIIGQLRDIYDGFYTRQMGGAKRKVEYTSRFSIITGVTPAILERKVIFDTELGERFLRFNIEHEDEDAIQRKVQENTGMMHTIRKEVAEVVDKFVEDRWLADTRLKRPSNPFSEQVRKLARLVARGRASVHRDQYRRVVDITPIAELPTRLTGQLEALLLIVAINREHEEITLEDFNLVKKVALDTIPDSRMRVLKHILEEDFATRLGIAQTLNVGEQKAREVMEDLTRLKLVFERELEKTGKKGRPPKVWFLEPEIEEALMLEAHGKEYEPIFKKEGIPTEPERRKHLVKVVKRIPERLLKIWHREVAPDDWQLQAAEDAERQLAESIPPSPQDKMAEALAEVTDRQLQEEVEQLAEQIGEEVEVEYDELGGAKLKSKKKRKEEN